MSETFRLARAEEVPEIAQVVAHSFVNHPPSYYEQLLRYGPWGGIETVWVCEEAGRVVGMCQLLPLQQWIGGACVRVMGMASVSVAPTHRRRGLAARLVTSGMRFARERGDVATALYPFRTAFYAKLGYGRAGEAHQFRIAPGTIRDAPERLRVSPADSPRDREAIQQIYERWAPTQTGQLRRTDAIWKRLLEGAGRLAVLVRDSHGTPEGYAVARYRADLPPHARFLEIEERVWLSDGARRGLYAWMGSLGDQWREVVYRAHPDEQFVDFVVEPRLPPGSEPGWGLWFPAAVVLHGPMFRVLDVGAAFAARRSYNGGSLQLRLEVNDPDIPENAGSWHIELEDGRARVGREAPSAGGTQVSLTLPVHTLSRILVGDLTPTEAVQGGEAVIDRTAALPELDAAFRVPRPWTFDAF